MVRRLLAFLAAVGFVSCGAVYVDSYFGLNMDAIWPGAMVLHIGAIALLAPMSATEYRSGTGTAVFGRQFLRAKPKLAGSVLKLLGWLALVHFIVFLIQSHAAARSVVNDQYVLNDHGRILRVLTRTEYVRLKGAELRLFASGWLFFYFVAWVHWWFPKADSVSAIPPADFGSCE